ncbi:MAG: alpha/beta hydrolase domain-containing protein [Chloroflexota bacterium]|nr:alpha/beta hydrolase domain-containing protein [Chloroflexota bacterium]
MPATKFETTFRRILADGKHFGDVGQYEEIRGVLSFHIDPENEANSRITDVMLAPRNQDGLVEFESDVSLILPVDKSKVSGKLLLDVVNRGNRVALPNFNRGTRPLIDENTPIDVEVDLGDGLLMEKGYVVVACGWQVDAPPFDALITMRGPEALDDDGSRLKGKVYMQLQSPEDTHNFLLSDKGHKPYDAADMHEASAMIEIRDMPDGPSELLPRDDWKFGRIDDQGDYHSDSGYVCSEKGFEKGRLYQAIYTAVGAPVIGLSFAALRDCVSWIKNGTEGLESPVDGIDTAYAYGRSQTGRFLRTFAYNDFNLDEEGRETLDGFIANVAGGMRGEFNQRFGQNSKDRNNMMHQLFPFASIEQTDPETEDTGSLHGRLDGRGSNLKIMYTNTSAEYHRVDASLLHTDPDGRRDIDQGPNTRVYHFAGTEHGIGTWPPTDNAFIVEGAERSQNIRSIIDYTPLLRACLINMDAWVTEGVEPPPSAHPKIGSGTLVHPSVLKNVFSKIPGSHYPERHPTPRRREFSPSEENEHPNILPPEIGREFGGLVPAVNADGNEIDGIIAPEIAVPVAAHTGWTLRHPDVGGDKQLLVFAGGTIPFSATRSERSSTGDPRLSIEERYSSKADYLDQVRAVAEDLVGAKYLLGEDVEVSVLLASRMWDWFSESAS